MSTLPFRIRSIGHSLDGIDFADRMPGPAGRRTNPMDARIRRARVALAGLVSLTGVALAAGLMVDSGRRWLDVIG